MALCTFKHSDPTASLPVTSAIPAGFSPIFATSFLTIWLYTPTLCCSELDTTLPQLWSGFWEQNRAVSSLVPLPAILLMQPSFKWIFVAARTYSLLIHFCIHQIFIEYLLSTGLCCRQTDIEQWDDTFKWSTFNKIPLFFFIRSLKP